MDDPNKHLLTKIGQYALITNDKKQVLLLQRKRSKSWSLPGGRLDKNDKDLKEALIREIKEETRLTLNNIKPFDTKLIEDPYQIKYCVFFTADCLNTSDLKLSQEHTSSKWIDEKDLKRLIIDDEPKVRQVLQQYFIQLKANSFYKRS